MSYLRYALVVASAAIIAGAALAAQACGGGASSPITVKATEKDFAINVDQGSVTHGKLQLQVTNEGPSEHELVVLKTDDAADDLPVSDGQAEEDSEGVEHVDEVEQLSAGQTDQLDLNLDAGNYVLICNLPGHYSQGMRIAFRVS